MPLNILPEIDYLRSIPTFGAYLSRALTRLQETINQIGQNTASDPTGTLPAPNPLASVNVASDGGNLVHVTLTDTNVLQKNTSYFIEHADNPAFANAHQEHLVASRGRILNLPQGTYYVRGYHQPFGGKPSKPVNFGGTVPTPIVITSGSTLSLLPSTGSGTAAPDGSQPGQGLGIFLSRPAPQPKRTSNL